MNELEDNRPIVKRINDAMAPERHHGSIPDQPTSKWIERAMIVAIVFVTIGIAEALSTFQRGQTLIEFAAK